LSSDNSYFVKLSAAIAFLSISLIAFELILIRILSIVQWYHFAYMVISVALLGFGAAGTFIAVFKESLIEKTEILLPWLMVLTSLLMSISVTISQTSLFSFDSYKLFSDFSHIWKLIATYMIFFPPFFFGALAIGLAFVKYVKRVGTLYSANMIGSGIGGLLVVLLMWWFFPQKLPAVVSTLAFFAAVIIVPQKLRAGFSLVVAAAVALLSFFYISSPSLNISEYKSISKTLNLPGSKIVKTECSPYGTIEIVSSNHLRYAPGLSIKYPGMISVNNAAFNNGDWLGPLISLQNDSVNYLAYSTEMLPYIISKRKDVLVLNSGTGRQVSTALYNNAQRVVAVEPNKALLELLTGDFATEVGAIYKKPGVQIRNISPRTFLLAPHPKFDLVTLPVISSFGGTSGLFALQEEYLLTKEAFEEMWGSLKDDGAISINTWIDYPYRNPLKLISTLAEVIDEHGIKNVSKHIAAIKNWNTISIIVKRSQITIEETEKIRTFCAEMNFDPVILPDLKIKERERFNKLQDDTFYRMIDKILTSEAERKSVYSNYSFNIKPATDDQPYYSQFLQFKSIPLLAELFGNNAVPFFEVGYILLYLTFFQILFISIILIIIPLFKLGWKGENPPSLKRFERAGRSWTFLYFCGLGIGYMFVEIVLIQKFTLYFGNVIYSTAAVVCLMLISSGFGSWFSQNLYAKPSRIVGVTALIILSLIIYLIFLTPIIKTTIAFTLIAKIFFATFLIAPPAFIMGVPFPLGLRLLSERNESTEGVQVPWAWGINGLFSVISVVLATIVAIELGFIWVMIIAAGAYSLSLLVNLRSA
jgi:spermidine synthase